MNNSQKKHFLFTVRGMTDRYFCGNIYCKSPDDRIKVCGEILTFSECEEIGHCEKYDTEKDANMRSNNQQKDMKADNAYAQEAMRAEEIYGCEGVDY